MQLGFANFIEDIVFQGDDLKLVFFEKLGVIDKIFNSLHPTSTISYQHKLHGVLESDNPCPCMFDFDISFSRFNYLFQRKEKTHLHAQCDEITQENK